MAKKVDILTIFVASPSDVADEKDALSRIINELNLTLRDDVRLELLRWETDTYPAFGSYPQDVINEQIGDDYDIFIAIFWSKVGTKTVNYESGTLEELDRAYKKYINNNDSIDLMVYFKDQPLPPSKIDYSQLQKISELKKQLGEKGGLYWPFDSVQDFESLVRVHLSRVVQKWRTRLSRTGREDSSNMSSENRVSEYFRDELFTDVECGLYDYEDIYEEQMAIMENELRSIAQSIENIGRASNENRVDVEAIINEGAGDRRKVKSVIRGFSLLMLAFAVDLNPKIDRYQKARELAFDAMTKSISIYINENNADSLLGVKDNISGMIEEALSTAEQIGSLKETTLNLPKLTLEFNKGKRAIASSLDRLIDEIHATITTSQGIIQTIEKIS